MARKTAAARRKYERQAHIRGLKGDLAVRWVERKMRRRARARKEQENQD